MVSEAERAGHTQGRSGPGFGWFLMLPGLEPAQSALREIGPKAVPFLLSKVEEQNALSRRIHRAIWWNAPGFLRRIVPKPVPVDSSLSMRIRWAVRPMGPEVIPQLARALRGSSVPVRYTVVDVLGYMDGSADLTIPALAQVLKDPYAEVRFNAVAALARIAKRQTNAIPVLIDALNDSNRGIDGNTMYVRERAADALGAFGSKAQASIPALTKLLNDKDSFTRQRAVIAIWQINQDTNLISRVITELETAQDVESYKRSLEVLRVIGPEAKAAILVVNRTMARWNGIPSTAAVDLSNARIEALDSVQPGSRLGPSK